VQVRQCRPKIKGPPAPQIAAKMSNSLRTVSRTQDIKMRTVTVLRFARRGVTRPDRTVGIRQPRLRVLLVFQGERRVRHGRGVVSRAAGAFAVGFGEPTTDGCVGPRVQRSGWAIKSERLRNWRPARGLGPLRWGARLPMRLPGCCLPVSVPYLPSRKLYIRRTSPLRRMTPGWLKKLRGR
jgi:hypothetical protein